MPNLSILKTSFYFVGKLILLKSFFFFLLGGEGERLQREFRGQFALSTQHFCTLKKHKSSQSKKKKAPKEMILILRIFFFLILM